MIKILIKAAILVCIILSIYFIVNPSACSNLMSGRVVNSLDQVPTVEPPQKSRNELLTPTGDKPLIQEEQQPQEQAQGNPVAQEPQTQQPVAVTDTNSAQPQPAAQPAYTQEQTDYAIARRYVELENEYMAQKKDMKNAAKEISYIVMDDFELTPAEWEAFLQRATASNLFEEVRQEQAASK